MGAPETADPRVARRRARTPRRGRAPLVSALVGLALFAGSAALAGAATPAIPLSGPAVAACRPVTGPAKTVPTVTIRAVGRRGVGIVEASRLLAAETGGVWACVNSVTFVTGPPTQLKLHLVAKATPADRRAIATFLRRTKKFTSVTVS